MAKEHGQGKVGGPRLLRMRQPKKSVDFFGKKAMALLDEILDSGMTTSEVIRTVFGISHMFLDVGQQILEHAMSGDDEEGAG